MQLATTEGGGEGEDRGWRRGERVEERGQRVEERREGGGHSCSQCVSDVHDFNMKLIFYSSNILRFFTGIFSFND